MSEDNKEKLGFVLIGLTVLLAIIAVLLADRIPQDESYHLFADSRRIWLIPNFWNVISNIPLLVVGILGAYKTGFCATVRIPGSAHAVYLWFFIGVILVAFGSGHYHLWPENRTLTWDRLPMAVTFMALFCIIVSEFIAVRIGKLLLLPLTAGGVLSVVYWHFSEIAGAGDLRPYALVQFLPMFLMPVIVCCFASRYTGTRCYWLLLVTYLAAKLCEHFDTEIYQALGVISGHSIKHVLVAAGIYILLIYFEKRRVCSAATG
ncbi:MAG: ceramidase domain-containing protein [Amphritea sp.]